MKKKTTWGAKDGYEEVPETAGKICNGVFLKKNKDGECIAVRITELCVLVRTDRMD